MLHPFLASALRRHRLTKFFNSLCPTLRIDFDYSISSVKKEATRLRRLDQMIELLTTAKEAELNPPPVIQAAFAHNPQARRGFELLPQQSRRTWLIAIFRSPYPETRAFHLENAIREWTRFAEQNPDVEP